MSDQLTILIADDNIEFGNILNAHLEKTQDFRVIGTAADGIQTLSVIREKKPDIVLLDLIMPNIDGLGVLEKVSELGLSPKPIFIILSAIGQDMFIHKAINLGAEYYMVKPFDPRVLVSRMRDICQVKRQMQMHGIKSAEMQLQASDNKGVSEKRIELEVTNLMRIIGIPAHLTGYKYIREAVIKAVQNVKVFASVTKILYPEVADKFDSTPQKVERAIRNAIEKSWDREDRGVYKLVFGNTIKCKKGKPTNSEFIAMLADRVKIELGMR